MDLSRGTVSQLLNYAFGVQTSILCTAFFQERLFTLSYAETANSQKLESFEDKNFVVFVMRFFVLTLLGVYFLARLIVGNRFQNCEDVQGSRLKIWQTTGLLSCVACVFGFSLENSVKSANNGSEFGLAIGLMISLVVTGSIALYSTRMDSQFSKATKSKFQMMLGMNVLNLLTSFQVVHQQQTVRQSFDFLKTHPIFLQDLIILCISEAFGQLFIYFTIERFGFIVFGLSLIGQKLLTAAIGHFYAITMLQSTLTLGVLSLLFSAFTGSENKKQTKQE